MSLGNTDGPVIEVMDDAMADVLRQKSPVERLRISFRMWKTARVILGASVRSLHPDWDENAVNREIARRISHGIVDGEFVPQLP